jgi:hypothetical protein
MTPAEILAAIQLAEVLTPQIEAWIAQLKAAHAAAQPVSAQVVATSAAGAATALTKLLSDIASAKALGT